MASTCPISCIRDIYNLTVLLGKSISTGILNAVFDRFIKIWFTYSTVCVPELYNVPLQFKRYKNDEDWIGKHDLSSSLFCWSWSVVLRPWQLSLAILILYLICCNIRIRPRIDNIPFVWQQQQLLLIFFAIYWNTEI